METMLSRQSEAVMMVVQDNEQNSLYVSGANTTLLQLLGYEVLPEDAPFYQFLGAKTRQIVQEDVEFHEDARDVLQVLCTNREVVLRTVSGAEIAMKCSISRSLAQHRNHVFRLVFFPIEYVNERRALINTIKSHFAKNHTIDLSTQLPDVSSMLHYIALTQQFSLQHHLSVCFVYMQLAGHIHQNTIEREAMLHHAGNVIARNLREDDTIGRVAQDALGIVLIDVNRTTVHLALNRIRHMIGNDNYKTQSGEELSIHTRQVAMMLQDSEPQEILDHCVALLNDEPESEMVLFKGAYKTNPFEG